MGNKNRPSCFLAEYKLDKDFHVTMSYSYQNICRHLEIAIYLYATVFSDGLNYFISPKKSFTSKHWQERPSNLFALLGCVSFQAMALRTL